MKVEGKGYNCRLCGAQKSKTIYYFFSIPFWISWRNNLNNSLTEIYDKNIGIEHDHQWAGGAYWDQDTWLFRGSFYGDGGHSVKPYPIYLPRLTYIALKIVDQMKSWHKEDKSALYYAILSNTKSDSFDRVQKFYELSLLKTNNISPDANQSDPNKIWTDWLKEHNTNKESSSLESVGSNHP